MSSSVVSSPKVSRIGSGNLNNRAHYHHVKTKMRSLSISSSSSTLSIFDQSSSSESSESATNLGNENCKRKQNSLFISLGESESRGRSGCVQQKSKVVPDILMINKYYGLIPQKFTITSRKCTMSTPRSANSSSRGETRVCPKPRAKSSNCSNRNGNVGKECQQKIYRSEDDSPDPIKRVFGASELEKRNVFGPVSKKMSVEKFKKWKASLGRLESLSQSTLLGVQDTHGRRRKWSTEEEPQRPVIKIDLNTVTWDEEHGNMTEDTALEKSQGDYNSSKCKNNGNKLNEVSRSEAYSLNGNGMESGMERSICLANNAINNDWTKEQVTCKGNDGSHEKESIPNLELEALHALRIEEKEESEQLPSPPSPLNEKCKHDLKLDETSNSESDQKITQISEERTQNRHENVWSGRAISLDEKILQEGQDKAGLSESDSSIRKRPTTASSSHGRSIPCKTFSTPNGFNPPSKVIPWTKSSGGKSLTLAERRAKFQRATSIHSSSSVSMELDEEDLPSEETEAPLTTTTSTATTPTTNISRVPSAAFRESRKPLYVTQPPEIATLVSQNNPNADEDIQIEIEKVAIMLRKAQSLHFSRSLDSGIVASEGRRASGSEDVANGTSSNDFCLETVQSSGTKVTELSLGASESSFSFSSSDSNSSDEDVGATGSNETVKRGLEGKSIKKNLRKLRSDGEGKVVKSSEMKQVSDDDRVKRQCSTDLIGSRSVDITKSCQSPTTRPVSTNLRRPPLKKAVSISCEQEIGRTGGVGKNSGNEANCFNENGKSSGRRPKTAMAVTRARSREGNHGAGTRSTHNPNNSNDNNPSHNYNTSQAHSQARQSRDSTKAQSESHESGNGNVSQGSRNRKILIKKALMEINQCSANLQRKWGILGRPRTAPGLGSTASNKTLSLSQNHPPKRKPLKASPFPISGNGKMGTTSSGKSSTMTATSNKISPAGNQSVKMEGGDKKRASSESPVAESIENGVKEESEEEKGQRGSKRTRSPFRQCFSLDEGALLGFSKMSVNDTERIPIFERFTDSSGPNGSFSAINTINDDEISFLSSKKREQCLKVYEKMMKTGCNIKLDTIFRGMLTPSEYRAFMRAAERAQEVEQNEDEEVKKDEEIEES